MFCRHERYGADCRIWTSVGACFAGKTESKGMTAPITPHPKNYWQLEAFGYKHGSLTSSRNFNVIFTTTRQDIVVPQQLFARLNSQLNLKKVGDEYKFDCSLKPKAEPITIKLKEDITVTPTVYIDQLNGECFLRVKPSPNNDWVLGYQFYYQYGICFHTTEIGRCFIQLKKMLNIPK